MPDEVLLPAQERTKPPRFDYLRCRPNPEHRQVMPEGKNTGLELIYKQVALL